MIQQADLLRLIAIQAFYMQTYLTRIQVLTEYWLCCAGPWGELRLFQWEHAPPCPAQPSQKQRTVPCWLMSPLDRALDVQCITTRLVY